MGIPVWCEDEAGPYQAIPQPGSSWQKEGDPAHRPHEYIRGGTAKLLTLFHPADGQVRALSVEQTTNAVLHPWLKEQLSQILADLPEPTAEQATSFGHSWADWGLEEEALLYSWLPIRCILVWDNLVGHYSVDMVDWCHCQGVLPLYTPLGGSWLNMAESVQRILIHRALAGQHPQSAKQIMDWLDATVRGWNADPTPFEWGGKRWQRRQRFRDRHKLGGSRAYTRRPVRRRWQSDDQGHAVHAAT
jgi:hypothetical protein